MSLLSPISTVRVLCRQHALRLGVVSSRRTNVTHSRPEPGLGQGIPPPLKGIKIVDLTRVLAAPTATMLLADLGYVCSKSHWMSFTHLIVQMLSRLKRLSAEMIQVREITHHSLLVLVLIFKPRIMATTLCTHHTRCTSGSISSSP